MTNISFHPSSQNPNGHKSIGVGGSFWLPPKMKAQTFEASFKNYSASRNESKLGQSALANQNTTQENSSTKVLLDKRQAYETKAVQSRHLRNIGTTPNKVTSKVGQNLASKGKHSNSLLVTGMGELSRVNTLSHVPLVSPIKIPQGSRVPDSPTGNSVIFAKIKEGSRSRDMILSSGTRNAHLFSREHEAYFQNTEDNPKKDFSSYHKTLTESEVVDEIRGSLSDMAIHSSHRNGIVRFAFSLENGSSVSVRIQQMKDHFQICFICDDKPSLVALSKKFHSSGNESNPTELPLHIHFFNSYKQMDKVLSSTPSLT